MQKLGEDRSERAKQFLTAVVLLERTYGLSITHEDSHGAFIVTRYDEQYTDWLMDAAEDTEVPHAKVG